MPNATIPSDTHTFRSQSAEDQPLATAAAMPTTHHAGTAESNPLPWQVQPEPESGQPTPLLLCRNLRLPLLLVVLWQDRDPALCRRKGAGGRLTFTATQRGLEEGQRLTRTCLATET